ncbi:hypothetical protein [Pendulispora albinea]|uniref:Uncharacterized protein n=1 Tax=Pendulispora albinea TaxID=2741071 RepID=A0ABZ2LUW2_9BACT
MSSIFRYGQHTKSAWPLLEGFMARRFQPITALEVEEAIAFEARVLEECQLAVVARRVDAEDRSRIAPGRRAGGGQERCFVAARDEDARLAGERGAMQTLGGRFPRRLSGGRFEVQGLGRAPRGARLAVERVDEVFERGLGLATSAGDDDRRCSELGHALHAREGIDDAHIGITDEIGHLPAAGHAAQRAKPRRDDRHPAHDPVPGAGAHQPLDEGCLLAILGLDRAVLHGGAIEPSVTARDGHDVFG